MARTVATCRTLRVLLIPADTTREVEVVNVADRAGAIADLIGVTLLADEPIRANLTGPGGQVVGLYLANDPFALPDNPRAAVLAARLGLDVDRAVMARIRGDVMVCGISARSEQDLDVPGPVASLLAQP
jgi:hypothetical protein